MQRTVFALIACLILFTGNAQPLTWVQGVVVLHDQSVFSGYLCFQRGDVILVKENNRLRVYLANQLLQVRYYDKKENINRIFYSMPELAQNKFSMRLYELVINGPLRVWRIPLTDSYELTYRNPNDYLYFVEWQGKRLPLRKFRTQVYPYLVWNEEVPEKLNPNKSTDALKMVLQYNQQCYSPALAGI